MADEKQPPKPPRHPTLPRVNEPIPDRDPTNEEIHPLGSGGIDWVKSAKIVAKAVPVVITAVALALVSAWHIIKPVIVEYKSLADQRTTKSYDVLAPEVNILKQRMHDVEVRLDTASKVPAVPPPRRPGAPRRPAPVLSNIPPAQHPPIAPRPLPKDLDKAQVLPPMPQPPRAVDAGP